MSSWCGVWGDDGDDQGSVGDSNLLPAMVETARLEDIESADRSRIYL